MGDGERALFVITQLCRSAIEYRVLVSADASRPTARAVKLGP
jgi:hypothetical protein